MLHPCTRVTLYLHSCPQMYREGTTGNIDKIVADIKEIGELGLQETPPVRFAYEALSWGAYLDLYAFLYFGLAGSRHNNVGGSKFGMW